MLMAVRDARMVVGLLEQHTSAFLGIGGIHVCFYPGLVPWLPPFRVFVVDDLDWHASFHGWYIDDFRSFFAIIIPRLPTIMGHPCTNEQIRLFWNGRVGSQICFFTTVFLIQQFIRALQPRFAPSSDFRQTTVAIIRVHVAVDRDTGQGHPCLKKTGKEDTTATKVREPFT